MHGVDDQYAMIRRLLAAGYSPVALSLALRMDLDEVAALSPEKENLATPDSLIEDGLRILAWRTIEEASRILDEGTPPLKMQLIKTFGTQMRDILGTNSSDGLDDLREQMNSILDEIRGEVIGDVQEHGALGEATDDPDQRSGVETDRP